MLNKSIIHTFELLFPLGGKPLSLVNLSVFPLSLSAILIFSLLLVYSSNLAINPLEGDIRLGVISRHISGIGGMSKKLLHCI